MFTASSPGPRPDSVGYSDLIGRVQIPVKQLMANPNTVQERCDPLMGFEDANKMDGKL